MNGIKKRKCRNTAMYSYISDDGKNDAMQSLKNHYERMIAEHKDMSPAGLYTDTAENYLASMQSMVDAAKGGKIDLILCPSITDLAAEPEDALPAVRDLKKHNVEIYFEKEDFSTLSDEGELLLNILIAELKEERNNAEMRRKNEKQKAEVTPGKKKYIHKSYFGYTYDRAKNIAVINPEQAEAVRYIFQRYADGAGAAAICSELEAKEMKTYSGLDNWTPSVLLKIVKNDIYKDGDPAIQREPIVSDGVWYKANAIIRKREYTGRPKKDRSRYSRKLAFSSKIQCGYCGEMYIRRIQDAKTTFRQVLWGCSNELRFGRQKCPESKRIVEDWIEKSFIEAMHILADQNDFSLDRLVVKAEKLLKNEALKNYIKELQASIKEEQKEILALDDLFHKSRVDETGYSEEIGNIQRKIADLRTEKLIAEDSIAIRSSKIQEMKNFKKTLINSRNIKEFDPEVFDEMIDKIIAGGMNQNNEDDPFGLTFVFKTIPVKIFVNSRKYRVDRRRRNPEEIPA